MDNRIDAIYGRQSIDKKDSISIESQFEFCRYELKGGEGREYKDKGYSGKNIERPDFQRLLQDIKLGLIKRVIVYKLDRISRSIVDFAKLVELFKQYNVEFVSCTEKFDTSTPMGRTPYGFDTEPIVMDGIKTKKLVETPEMFAGDNSCYLYQDREGEEQILVIAPHQGRIPSSLWLAVQCKLSQNTSFLQNGRKCHHTWLAGKIKCGRCGYALTALKAQNGVVYLRCKPAAPAIRKQ